MSNAYATVEPDIIRTVLAVLMAVLLVLAATVASAQPASAPEPSGHSDAQPGQGTAKTGRFLAGAAVALAAHESGHLFLDVLFDAKPRLKKVDFHGLPFFAIAHRTDLSPRREFLVSSAGFSVQHLENEWLLTRRPAIRRERAPFAKGLLTFNVLTSVAYSGAAFARTGPHERDTRGMADAARVDERVIGALVLAPALLDAWRYFHPESKWASWTSRGAKAGLMLLVIR